MSPASKCPFVLKLLYSGLTVLSELDEALLSGLVYNKILYLLLFYP